MAKRIVAIYDRGIDKNLMQGFDVLEKYGYELTLVEKTGLNVEPVLIKTVNGKGPRQTTP